MTRPAPEMGRGMACVGSWRSPASRGSSWKLSGFLARGAQARIFRHVPFSWRLGLIERADLPSGGHGPPWRRQPGGGIETHPAPDQRPFRNRVGEVVGLTCGLGPGRVRAVARWSADLLDSGQSLLLLGRCVGKNSACSEIARVLGGTPGASGRW